jgi:hypothetical protein
LLKQAFFTFWSRPSCQLQPGGPSLRDSNAHSQRRSIMARTIVIFDMDGAELQTHDRSLEALLPDMGGSNAI